MTDSAKVPAKKHVSVHATILNVGVGGDPAITPALANQRLGDANEQWAQAGILLIPNNPIPVVNAPGIVDLRDGLDPETNAPGGEMHSLLASNLGSATDADIEVVFVNYLRIVARPNIPIEGVSYDTTMWGNAPPALGGDVSVLGATVPPFASVAYVTAGHELGHVLTSSGHYDGQLFTYNLMRGGPPPTIDFYYAPKRLLQSQVDMVFAPRTPNLLGDA